MPGERLGHRACGADLPRAGLADAAVHARQEDLRLKNAPWHGYFRPGTPRSSKMSLRLMKLFLGGGGS